MYAVCWRGKFIKADGILIESITEAALFPNFASAREELLKEVDDDGKIPAECYVCPVNVTVELAE